ncbi:MAG TPA: response regulator, partial [Candidatus Eisenbacteria bacterium]|nr:response regulator [Candidatus Eisenbacteria bacterium]
EVTRVAREVGTEGKLGGQAQVKGVAGTWKDLTDNVNWMASNLTTQVRGIARVVTAAANGDLKRKLVLEAKGEIAELADTINGMTDTLAVFADQVITVAREVGIEGKLGGQARVPGASGQWRDLTDNVNQLAANLTTQVRAIAEVATAVTNGDLSRSITVEAQGEVAALKDNINEMIRNLRDTTLKNTEQDWLKTNVARFTRLLQGQRDPLTVTKLILSELCPLIEAQHAVMYVPQALDETTTLRMLASYAFKERKSLGNEFALGEGLVGQCALEKERILVRDVPHDYVVISSGLGQAPPYNIAVLPVLFEGEIKAVVEIASFRAFSDIHLNLLEQLTESIGIVLNTLEANLRTEDLLKQSQSLAEELQSQQEQLQDKNTRLEQQARSLQRSEDLLRQQQEELQKTNTELEEKARLLTSQKVEVERKNYEVERAKWQLEEKADQLTLTSRYKSEFLANMSHELRTPLNSLLLLSEMLAKNEHGNLTDKQVEFARAIHGSGSDLLELINDILDLSKIESGAMQVDLSRVPLSDVADYVERAFRPIAEGKGLAYAIDVEPLLPHSIRTDARRLQQVLKNLLSNAFKFTEQGQVTLRITSARRGWSGDHSALNEADLVVAFSVTDTGIGIPADKHQIIFEAFQQADGTTSRRFGGTGLGLSISREIATLLGGEIRLSSAPGEGSTFTLYLPAAYSPRPGGRNGAAPRPPRDAPAGLVPVFAEEPADADVAPAEEVVDDRAALLPGDPVVLIVEDDPGFARVLLDMVRGLGLKALVTSRASRALALVREYRPLALTLDLELPDADGWTVLDRLKQDPATRHVPVQVISVSDQDWRRAIRMGAFGYLHKPASGRELHAALSGLVEFARRSEKRVLLVAGSADRRDELMALLDNGDVTAVAVGSAVEATEAVARERYDCVVLDAEEPGLGEFRVPEPGAAARPVPIVLHRETAELNGFDLTGVAEHTPITEVATREALLAETARIVHCRDAQLAPPQRALLEAVRQHDPLLAGRTVLVVDDDVRNIFALTTVLENRQMTVRFAENGRDAISLVQSNPEVDVVLMDVMMPGMDGYETMHAIRALERGRPLPIIALTAKAMPGDRENCLRAGATAYLAKPVDVEQLFSQLRVVLAR